MRRNTCRPFALDVSQACHDACVIGLDASCELLGKLIPPAARDAAPEERSVLRRALLETRLGLLGLELVEARLVNRRLQLLRCRLPSERPGDPVQLREWIGNQVLVSHEEHREKPMIEPALDVPAPGSEVLPQLRCRPIPNAGHPRHRIVHAAHGLLDVDAHVVGVADGDVARVPGDIDRPSCRFRRNDRRPVRAVEQRVMDLPVPGMLVLGHRPAVEMGIDKRPERADLGLPKLARHQPGQPLEGTAGTGDRRAPDRGVETDMPMLERRQHRPHPCVAGLGERGEPDGPGGHPRSNFSMASAGSSTPGRWRSSSTRLTAHPDASAAAHRKRCASRPMEATRW